MKKITSVFCFCLAGLLSVQAQQNLLQNGGFEDRSYTPFNYEEIKNCPNTVAGWDLISNPNRTDDFNNVGLNKYVVRATMGVYDPVEDENNKQYIRIQQYEWFGDASKGGTADMTADGGIQQTVDVLPSTTYTFSYLCRLSQHTENGRIVPAYYSIQEDNQEPVSRKIFNEMDEKWHEVKKEFITSATAKQVRVRLYISGKRIYTWGGNMQQWADFDDVKLVVGGSNAIESTLASVSPLRADVRNLEVSFSGLIEGERVSVYDGTGRPVASFTAVSGRAGLKLPSKGIYIVQNGVHRKPVKFVAR